MLQSICFHSNIYYHFTTSYNTSMHNGCHPLHSMLTSEAWMLCFMKIWWSFIELTWSHYFGFMPTLMKLWRFDVIHVEQALNVCPPHGSIIRKECLMLIIHIVDLVALMWCNWSLLCLLICWNIFQHVKMCLLICWMNYQ